MSSLNAKKLPPSLKYQPRRMVLYKNKRIHVLGMSLTHLNISTSYKNRIRALLNNNKALAQALSHAQRDIAVKERELLEFKRTQYHVPTGMPAIVKNNLSLMSEHLTVMAGLVTDAIEACNSKNDLGESSVDPCEEARQAGAAIQTNEAATRVGQVRKEKTPLLFYDQYINNLTVIEEQSVTETLPPQRFVELDAHKPPTGEMNSARSTSRSHSAERILGQTRSKSSRRSSLFSSENFIAETVWASSASKTDLSVASVSRCSPSMPGNNTSIIQKESYENDYAIQFDPELISRALSIHGGDSCTNKIEFVQNNLNEDDEKTELIQYASSGKMDKQCIIPTVERPFINTIADRTSTEPEDMELTGAFPQSFLFLRPPPQEKALKNDSKDKKGEPTRLQSEKFAESMLEEISLNKCNDDDPEYLPWEEKKRKGSTQKGHITKTKKKAEDAAENVTHKFFSDSLKKRIKVTSGKTKNKTSKGGKKKGEKTATKRDVFEHPSAVFDLSDGDSFLQPTIQPYKPFKKSSLLLPEEKSGSDKKRLSRKESYNSALTTDNVCAEERTPSTARKDKERHFSVDKEDTDFFVPQKKCRSKTSAASCRKSRRTKSIGKENVAEQIKEVSTNAEPQPTYSRSSDMASKGATPDDGRSSTDGEPGRARRRAVNIISYKDPSLNKKLRRNF